MNKSSFPPTALSAKQACHSKGKGKNLVTTAHFGLSALYFKDTRQINHQIRCDQFDGGHLCVAIVSGGAF